MYKRERRYKKKRKTFYSKRSDDEEFSFSFFKQITSNEEGMSYLDIHELFKEIDHYMLKKKSRLTSIIIEITPTTTKNYTYRAGISNKKMEMSELMMFSQRTQIYKEKKINVTESLERYCKTDYLYHPSFIINSKILTIYFPGNYSLIIKAKGFFHPREINLFFGNNLFNEKEKNNFKKENKIIKNNNKITENNSENVNLLGKMFKEMLKENEE